jgi:hypothetical protein
MAPGVTAEAGLNRMSNTIFFSWQVDTEPREGRNLIERALERAASRIAADTTVEEAVREFTVDRDTKGVAGSPAIVDTIFRKIDNSAVFVPDLTFIGKRPDGRPTPNPNVLIEYGWALKSVTNARIVPVMNTAFGQPTAETMPFDMRHLRNPITYHCPDNLDDAARRLVKEGLAKELEHALRVVLASEEFKNSLPRPPEPVPFIQKEPAITPGSTVHSPGRFRPLNEPLGIVRGGFYDGPQAIALSLRPVIWFRMMPTTDPGRTWTIEALEKAMKEPMLYPLSQGWGGYGFLRSHDGYGVYATSDDDRKTARSIVFAFTTGEVWSIDTHSLEAFKDDRERLAVPNEESPFHEALKDYGRFLQALGVKPPFGWIAGMENLKDRVLYIPAPPGRMRLSGPQGHCVVDTVIESGIYSPGDSPGRVLKPFFSKLYAGCCVSREAWQDN